jgi:predicted PurR-regulated permease PerM
MQPDLKFPFYAKSSLIFVGLVAFMTIMYLGQGIIVPIILSTIIAIVLSPVVNLFVKKGMNRAVAIAVILSLVMLITALIITLLSIQLMQFSDSFPKLIDKSNEVLNNLVLWVSETFNISIRKVNLWMLAKKTEMLAGGSTMLGQTLLNTGSVLIALLLIPVYIFMILYYQPLLLEFIHMLFKTNVQNEVNSVLTGTKKVIQSYLVGLMLEALIVAILNSASLLILGIDYAILLGVIGALLNIIPYLGGIIAVALPMMIALATKSSSSYCLLVLASYFVIQLIDNNYIIPKVVASKVKINALISIIVVLIGGALWGIPGMFLSIPLTAIIKVICDHIEPLKPWGYLLGDTMPSFLGIRSPFKIVGNKIQLANKNY